MSVTAGLALKGAGVLAKSLGARGQRASHRRLTEAELARQAGFQEEASKSIAGVLAGFRAPSAAHLRTGAPTLAPVSGTVPTGSAPESVRTNLGKMMRDALSKGKETARLQSRLSAPSRQVREGVQSLSDLGLNLDRIRDFARGSYNVLGEELGSSSADNTMGDILSGIGDISLAKVMRGS